MRIRLRLAGLAVASVLAASCNGPVDPAKNVSEQFSAVVAPGTAVSQVFTVGRTGELFVTLVSLTPPLPAIAFGPDIRVTAVVSGQCGFNVQIVGVNPHSPPGQQAFFAPTITSGQYCLWVSDAGSFSVSETYVVTVSHP